MFDDLTVWFICVYFRYLHTEPLLFFCGTSSKT